VVKKRNVGRLLKSGCNEEENEEILKLLFKNIPKKRGNAYPIFVNLFFRYSLIVLPLAGFLRLQIIFNTNSCNMFTSFYVLFVGYRLF
jgi:hypothetical protein